ncbi:YokU family protein, partial [Bacillus licheniformis]
MKKCEWGNEEKAAAARTAVYWELPDGTKAIEITDTPAVECEGCGRVYQEGSVTWVIENQQLLIDT